MTSMCDSLTLRVPEGYAPSEHLLGAPEQVAGILDAGVRVHALQLALASGGAARDAEARVEAAERMVAESKWAAAEAGRAAAASMAAARREHEQQLLQIGAELGRTAAKAAETATVAAEARMTKLTAELNELRASTFELIRVERQSAREEAGGRLEAAAARVAQLEAELAAGRARDAESASAGIAGLSARFDSVFSARAASSGKGRSGELTLAALLLRLFPDAELEDCSAAAGQGDATLTLQRGGRAVRLLIESKNVTRVSAADVAKFERDCANRAAEVDGALFAALVADSVPRKGRVHFETAANVPALYLARVVEEPEMLRLGVEALVYAALSHPREAESAAPGEWGDVRETVSLAFAVLTRHGERARALRAAAAGVLDAAAGLESEASVAIAAVNALWAARPGLRSAAPRQLRAVPAAKPNTADSHAQKLRAHMDSTGAEPTSKEILALCGITMYGLRQAGGARALVAKAKALAEAEAEGGLAEEDGKSA